MKKLAITGHLTRGNEVIKILEMLGGKNCFRLNGDKNKYFYYIGDKYKDISYSYIGPDEINGYEILSLDDFLEKFPYKVGDKVYIYVQNDDIDGRYDIEIAEIISMRWNSARCKIVYKMKDINREFYKEEIKCKVDDNNTDYSEKGKYNVEKYLKLFDESEHGLEVYIAEGYDIKEIDGHFYIVKQKPTYPKTYEECCAVLGITYDYPDIRMVSVDECSLYSSFIELIRCRDAYWKIAGEEMKLNKSWKPDFSDDSIKYNIFSYENEIILNDNNWSNRILVFPIAEMRDTFYKNFKDLIEKCKELL